MRRRELAVAIGLSLAVFFLAIGSDSFWQTLASYRLFSVVVTLGCFGTFVVLVALLFSKRFFARGRLRHAIVLWAASMLIFGVLSTEDTFGAPILYGGVLLVIAAVLLLTGSILLLLSLQLRGDPQ